MTTSPKPKPANLHIVPDVEQLEKDMTESVAGMELPAVSRASTRRNQMAAERQTLRAERDSYLTRQSLLDSQYTGASGAIKAHLDDIDATLALYPVEAGE